MRDYGKIYASFWTSETTRDLSDQGKLLAVYLISGPHTNMIGCFRLPDGYVREDLGWPARTVSEGFGELFRKGFATRDESTKWVLIPAYFRWNPIENPNQGKAAARLFQMVPGDVAFKSQLAKLLDAQGGRVPRGVLEPFLNGFETVRQTVSKPGSGTEAGTEAEAEAGEGAVAAEPAIPELTPDEFQCAWNEAAKTNGWSACAKMGAERLKSFRARRAEDFWRDNWRKALAVAAEFPALAGDNDRGWRADVEWFLRPETVSKIIEGKYENWTKTKPASNGVPSADWTKQEIEAFINGGKSGPD